LGGIGATVVTGPGGRAAGAPGGFNAPGNLLITDGYNNRVIEIDRSGRIVWQFGHGPGDRGPGAIVGVNDAERVGDLTLMVGTGIAPGATAFCHNGCPDERVLLVDPQGNVVWQYGHFGVRGASPGELDTPVQATFLPATGNVLITDQANDRVLEVRRADNTIVWQYGETRLPGNELGQLSSPSSAQLLPNGDILIADQNNNRAIEVTHQSPAAVIATFTARGTASGVAFASRLPDGHTLLTDSNNNRVVEVDATDAVVWEYTTNARNGSNAMAFPTRAVRLANGDTLISDHFDQQVLEVSRAKKIVATFGTLDDAGYNPEMATLLNGPFSAYRIGDSTGLTPP
jgi:hypothetical protein